MILSLPPSRRRRRKHHRLENTVGDRLRYVYLFEKFNNHFRTNSPSTSNRNTPSQHRREANRLRQKYVVENSSSSDDNSIDDSDFGDVGEIIVRVPRVRLPVERAKPRLTQLAPSHDVEEDMVGLTSPIIHLCKFQLSQPTYSCYHHGCAFSTEQLSDLDAHIFEMHYANKTADVVGPTVTQTVPVTVYGHYSISVS